MMELVTSLWKLGMGLLCILGPVVLLFAFLRIRDLREDSLRTKSPSGIEFAESPRIVFHGGRKPTVRKRYG